MAKKNRSEKRVSRSRIPLRSRQLPLDTYEEWLERQNVKHAATKREVQVPLDSYEEWIRRQVNKRVE